MIPGQCIRVRRGLSFQYYGVFMLQIRAERRYMCKTKGEMRIDEYFNRMISEVALRVFRVMRRNKKIREE